MRQTADAINPLKQMTEDVSIQRIWFKQQFPFYYTFKMIKEIIFNIISLVDITGKNISIAS